MCALVLPECILFSLYNSLAKFRNEVVKSRKNPLHIFFVIVNQFIHAQSQVDFKAWVDEGNPRVAGDLTQSGEVEYILSVEGVSKSFDIIVCQKLDKCWS